MTKDRDKSKNNSVHPEANFVFNQKDGEAESTAKQFWLKLVQQHRAIAVIRATTFELGCQMTRAVAAGGMQLIELTWDSDRPLQLITHLQQELPSCTFGIGTLLNREAVQEAIAAGAQFLFAPHTDPTLIRVAIDAGIPMVSGALTPTEILTAWQSGAASVKVFPIQAMGGASYIRSLQVPLGKIPLIPTGGVTPENAREFLAAGAIAVGLAGQLFPTAAIEAGNWGAITQRAEVLMRGVEEWRSGEIGGWRSGGVGR
jgi:2-dehydro-3-deoxyphosphogluconate aldolase / (4S)-4-hydroxy-2-oxoglutarate aldolase